MHQPPRRLLRIPQRIELALGLLDQVLKLGQLVRRKQYPGPAGMTALQGDLYNEYPGKHSRFTRRSVFTLDSSLDSPDNVFLKRYRFPVTHEIQRQYIVLFASREVSTGARL